MVAPLSTGVQAEDYVQVYQANGPVLATISQVVAAALAQSANETAAQIIALKTRIAALEGKPPPIVHFSASFVPGTLIVGTKTFTVTVKGVLPSDFLAAEPSAALPSGVVVGSVRALAADTVEIALTTGVALIMSAPITLLLVALR